MLETSDTSLTLSTSHSVAKCVSLNKYYDYFEYRCGHLFQIRFFMQQDSRSTVPIRDVIYFRHVFRRCDGLIFVLQTSKNSFGIWHG